MRFRKPERSDVAELLLGTLSMTQVIRVPVSGPLRMVIIRCIIPVVFHAIYEVVVTSKHNCLCTSAPALNIPSATAGATLMVYTTRDTTESYTPKCLRKKITRILTATDTTVTKREYIILFTRTHIQHAHIPAFSI